MRPDELLGYAGTCVDVVLSIVLIAVGAAVVRPVRATSGWLLAGAGIVSLLTDCCTSGLDRALRDTGNPEVTSAIFGGINLVTLALFFGLIVTAVATLGAGAAPADPDARPPMG